MKLLETIGAIAEEGVDKIEGDGSMTCFCCAKSEVFERGDLETHEKLGGGCVGVGGIFCSEEEGFEGGEGDERGEGRVVVVCIAFGARGGGRIEVCPVEEFETGAGGEDGKVGEGGDV